MTEKMLREQLTDLKGRRPALADALTKAEAALHQIEDERKLVLFAARAQGDRTAQRKLTELTTRHVEATREVTDARMTLEQADAMLHDLQLAVKKAARRQQEAALRAVAVEHQALGADLDALFDQQVVPMLKKWSDGGMRFYTLAINLGKSARTPYQCVKDAVLTKIHGIASDRKEAARLRNVFERPTLKAGFVDLSARVNGVREPEPAAKEGPS